MQIVELLAMPNGIKKAKELMIRALINDAAHHKQWYLERALEALDVNLAELRKELEDEDYSWEEGIAP